MYDTQSSKLIRLCFVKQRTAASKLMIISATLKYLEKPFVGPVSKTLHLHFTDKEKTVSQIRATSQELRRPILRSFPAIGKEQK